MADRTDIEAIPEEELRKDLQDSYDDIALCKMALFLGVVDYSSGGVQDRLIGNQRIVKVILAELSRRNALTATADNNPKEED